MGFELGQVVAVVGLIGTATAVCSFVIAKSYRAGIVISENRLNVNMLKDKVKQLDRRTTVLERAIDRRRSRDDEEL